jgi:hypothetical protein
MRYCNAPIQYCNVAKQYGNAPLQSGITPMQYCNASIQYCIAPMQYGNVALQYGNGALPVRNSVRNPLYQPDLACSGGGGVQKALVKQAFKKPIFQFSHLIVIAFISLVFSCLSVEFLRVILDLTVIFCVRYAVGYRRLTY